jgi:tetratricopeptide (TPR) repeat protein
VDERRLFETWGEWKRIEGRSVENLAEDLQFRWNTAEAERAEAASLWSKAETHLTALIKVNDERWGLFARRGKVRHKLRRDAEAAADFSRAIELGPLNRSIWADRGTSLAELGRFREAAADFAASRDHSVEKRHPDEAWAWLAIGDRDRYRRLRAEIEKDTLENSRDDVEVLAWLYAVPSAEPPLSATYFAKLAEFASEADVEVTLKRTYCAVLLRRGEVARSLAELDVLVKKYPEDEIASLLHILALARDGKEAEAKAERIVSFKRLDDPARLAKLTWQDRVAAQLLRQQITAKE